MNVKGFYLLLYSVALTTFRLSKYNWHTKVCSEFTFLEISECMYKGYQGNRGNVNKNTKLE